MFTIDNRETLKLERKLDRVAEKAIPFAIRGTLTKTAQNAARGGKANIERQMIERNRFTKGSVRANFARGFDIDRMKSEAGSLQEYLATQEFGGTKKKPILPTTSASGEGRTSRPRKRLPRPSLRMQRINLAKRGVGKSGTDRQRIASGIREAKARGEKFIFIGSAKRKAIYRIDKNKLTMLYNLDRKDARIPKNAWLEPAADKARRGIPLVYRGQLRAQLRRQGFA